jgi:hypothetical protein
MNIAGYDAWILRGPDEDHEIGCDLGDDCNRYPEPDEDQPRGYRPRPCNGWMVQDGLDLVCDTCGALA